MQMGVVVEEPLLEREGEVAEIEAELTRLASGVGAPLLIEGPAGIGKTRLMRELRARAEQRGLRVIAASGSEMELEFGFGLVRQLLGPTIASLDAERREELLSDSGRLAAGVFGLEEAGFSTTAEEASLYGLYWLVASLAENGPLVIAVDDAHWADAPSLRFARYLGRRLDGLGVTIALAARQAEPGAQNEVLADLIADLDPLTIRPAALGERATSALIRNRLPSAPTADVESACLRATGGNPFLIGEFLAEVEAGEAAGDQALLGSGKIGRAKIGASIARRAERLGARAADLVRAVAILGDRVRLEIAAELASVDPGEASRLAGALAAAEILDAGSEVSFAHPLLRQSVLDDFSAPERCEAHARAAALLRDRGAEAEVVASHLLLAPLGSVPGAVAVLDEAARKAELRGAPKSTAAYLHRALDETPEPASRAEILRRLGNAELSVREPAALQHLEMAAEATDDPRESAAITAQLSETLSMAGMWEECVVAIERGFARLEGTDQAALLDLEAVQTAIRGYDPARRAEYEAELPRLLSLASGRRDPASNLLRWILAGVESYTDAPRARVLELAALDPSKVTMEHRPGYESLLVMQAALALLAVDELGSCDSVVAALLADGRRRGSLGATMAGRGYVAALAERRGDLRAAEADLRLAVDLIAENDLSLMLLTTTFIFCVDAIIERRELADLADLAEHLELPPAFAATMSGAMLLEVRATVRLARGKRAAGCADLRAAGTIFTRLRVGPRLNRWRSRLALGLPREQRDEALALARQELEHARRSASLRAEGAALRALGLLEGGEEGIELLERSVGAARGCPSRLEVARSLAALGGALRRGNRRSEARERLREALELARDAGAERLSDEIVEEMRTAGARMPERELSGVGSLTPAELRVAGAAASGATNREIAQDLFVSLRTVEMHLTNAYRKLEITSRAGLAEALAS